MLHVLEHLASSLSLPTAVPTGEPEPPNKNYKERFISKVWERLVGG